MMPPCARAVSILLLGLFCSLAPRGADAVLTWRRLPNSPIVQPRMQDVAFVGALHGWSVDLAGNVARTTDGGATWATMTVFGSNLRCVGFANELTGWAGSLGDCFSSDTPASVLYATTDGGATWAPVTNIPEPKPHGLCGIWVESESVVYAVGRYCGTPRVVKTTDGGANWSTFDLSGLARGLVDVRFWGPDTGLVTGNIADGTSGEYRGVILGTTDGGASWTTRHTTSTEGGVWCWKLSFPTREVGYVSAQHEIAEPNYLFLKTTDGGFTWEEKPLPIPGYNYTQGIGFVTEMVGWIGGMSTTYGTTDGGVTWAVDDFGAGDDNVNRIRLVHGTLAYAAGRRIYKYSDDAAVGVPGETSGVPVRVVLHPSEPNPVDRHALARFDLASPGPARLSLVDVTGREVAVISEGSRAAGPHAVPFLASGLPSGVYILRLDADQRVATRKIQVLH